MPEFTFSDVQVLLAITALVYAYFKYKFDAKMIDSDAKLRKAVLVLILGLILVGGTYSKGFLGTLFVTCMMVYAAKSALRIGYEGALTTVLAVALVWSVALG